MIRPDGGSAATKASRSGGRYLSVTVRCIRSGRCIHRTGCETAPDDFYSSGAVATQETLLVVSFVLAFAFAVAMSVVSAFRVAAEGAIISAHDLAIVIVIIALRLSVLLVVFPLLLPDFLLPPLLRLLPLLVVVDVIGAAVQDREAPVRVPAGALNHQVAVSIADATLVDRVVVASLADLIPTAIDTIANIGAIRGGATATENDVADAVRGLIVRAIRVAIVRAVVVRAAVNGARADDRHVAAIVAHRPLNENVAVAVLGAALINRVAVSIATDDAPLAIDAYGSVGAR